MIPTFDRRVYVRDTKLVVSALFSPYLQHVIGDMGEHIEVHPTIPIAPFRFSQYGDCLYISGTYVSRFDGKHFMGVTLTPPPYAVTGGVVFGDNYILSGIDVLHVYDLRTGRRVKSYYDYAFLYYFEPVEGGYVGVSTSVVVHVDNSFNPIKIIPIKGFIPGGVVYDGNYYVVEDRRYVRKYDSDGKLLIERVFPDASHIVMLSDGIYVVYDDGVVRLDSNLNVLGWIRRADVVLIRELGDYYYMAVYPSTIIKLRKDTLEKVASYTVGYAVLIGTLRSTDDGNLLITVTMADGKNYVKILSPDFQEIYSVSVDELPYLEGVNDAYKIPGTNEILVSNASYAINFRFNMYTKEVTWIYTNFAPYDVDYNGEYYALAIPIKGEVRILDNDLRVVKSIPMPTPSSLRFYRGELYVVDYYLNRVYVFDKGFNLVRAHDLSNIFTKYNAWSIGRVEGVWFVTDLLTKVVLFNDDFKPIKTIPIKISGECVTDLTVFKGKYYMLGNSTFSVYEVDSDGNVISRYTYPGIYYDKAYPSHTGGLVLVGPLRTVRFFKDMRVEKSIPFITTYFYRTPRGNYVGTTYIYGPTSIIAEYDLNGELVRYLVIDGIIAFQACVTSDDKLVISESTSMEVRKYDWGGNLIWRVPLNHSPKIAPRHDFRGVFTYGVDRIASIDLDGNVSVFIYEPGTFFYGVFEDDRYVYVLDDRARVRRYSKDGKYLGTVYEFKWDFGMIWLTGGVEDNSKPHHVFR